MTVYTRYVSVTEGEADYTTNSSIVELEKGKENYKIRIIPPSPNSSSNPIEDMSAIDHVLIKAKQNSIVLSGQTYGGEEITFDGTVERVSDYTYIIVPENAFLTTPIEKPADYPAYTTRIYMVAVLYDENDSVLGSIRFNVSIKEDTDPITYYRTIRWNANMIPTNIHVSQGDTNIRFIFDMELAEGEISGIGYYTTGIQLRGTRPDDVKVILNGDAEVNLSTYDVNGTFPNKSSIVVNGQTASSMADLTAVAGIIPLQVVCYQYTTRTVSGVTNRFITKEYYSSKINLIVEPRP